LLEAGDDDAKNPNVHIPMSAPELANTDFSYQYKTVPQERAARGMKDRVGIKACDGGVGVRKFTLFWG